LRAVWTTHRSIVLRTTTDIVERGHVIRRHPVELRHRQIAEVAPSASRVPRLVKTAIVAEHDMHTVFRIRPDYVMVYVYPLGWKLPPGASAIGAALQLRAYGPNRFAPNGIHEYLVVITGVGVHVETANGLRRCFRIGVTDGRLSPTTTAPARSSSSDARPGGTLVIRPVKTPLGRQPIYHCVYTGGPHLGVDRQVHPPHVHSGKSPGELCPRCAGIR
jgi:hypothetical protein